MIDRYQALFWLYVALMIFIPLFFYFLGTRVHGLYFAGVLSAIPLAFISYAYRNRMTVQRLLRRAEAAWSGDTRPGLRDLDSTSRAYKTILSGNSPDYALDDTTWTDLDMDLLYESIDRTLTTPGEVLLYKTLRCPETTSKSLNERRNIINLLQSNLAFRRAIQMELARLNKLPAGNLTALLWSKDLRLSPLRKLLPLLTLLAWFALAGTAFWGFNAVMLGILPVFIINGVITYRLVRGHVYLHIGALRYLGDLSGCAERIAKIDVISDWPEQSCWQSRLNRCAQAASRIHRQTRLLTPEQSSSAELVDIVREYLSIYLLLEARAFYRVLDELQRHETELRQLYTLIGELDAWLSVAAYRAHLPRYAEPDFTEGAVRLEVDNLTHPLVADPVPNSIAIVDKNILVSGPNMTGKSTFLRALAVNAVLAQTIHTCHASAYRASFFNIITSINHADRLDEHKSLFLMETERLLHMLRSTDCDIPPLCLIDEPLRGTNSDERFAAATAVLTHMASDEAVIAVSTHDTDLARALSSQYDNYHFTCSIEHEGFMFDYRIKRGVAPAQNAIPTMDRMGYPETVVREAKRKLAERESAPRKTD